jgi:hypothetical protein
MAQAEAQDPDRARRVVRLLLDGLRYQPEE